MNESLTLLVKATKGGLFFMINIIEKPSDTGNPYSFNSVSLKKNDNLSLTASETIVDPLHNIVGKSLGVDTIHDWNKYYDKVQKIVNWAKEETGYTEKNKLVNWIYEQSSKANSLGAKKIDDVYIYSKLKLPSKAVSKPKPKVIIKKVYVKQKLTTDEMIRRIIRGEE